MNAREIMTAEPRCCTPDDGLIECARIMKEVDTGIVPVVNDVRSRELTGVVTDRDIVVRCIAAGKDVNTCRVADVMTTDVITCSPHDDLDRVVELMEEHQLRRICVCEGKRLVGVIAQADLARELEQSRAGAFVREVSQPSA